MTDVDFTTNLGDIIIQLFDNDAPQTVQDFLSYAENTTIGGGYTNSFFHRLTVGFVLQGGGYDLDGGQVNTITPERRSKTNTPACTLTSRAPSHSPRWPTSPTRALTSSSSTWPTTPPISTPRMAGSRCSARSRPHRSRSLRRSPTCLSMTLPMSWAQRSTSFRFRATSPHPG